MLDDYQDRLDYLYGRLNYEWVGMPRVPAELRLRRMRRLMRRLGDPHLGLRVIHIAGTKGKGSTAALMAAALSAAGYRTGLYCSPHLHRLEERYCIDGRPASPAELVELVDEVRAAVEQLELDDPQHRHRGSTFFEITTAMGLLHFARRRAEAVVLEVGMGGRLDSTNVVHPALCVITSIAFDHTRQLGNTLGAIATEKAGILKRSPAGRQRRHRGRAAAGDPPGRGPEAVPLARAGSRLCVRIHRAAAASGPAHSRPGPGPDLADELGYTGSSPPGLAPGAQCRGCPGGSGPAGRGRAVPRGRPRRGRSRASRPSAGRREWRCWASLPGW